MEITLPYQLLADAVLLVHFAIVLFVVGGLALIVVGNVRGWQWVNALWFRLAHIGAIGIVVAQAWLGRLCPLTVFESWLRRQAGEAVYQASFIEHWVQRALYFDAPPWMFTLAYTIFGLSVLLAWWCFPPRRRSRRPPRHGHEEL